MAPNYCPHCRLVAPPADGGGRYTIALCNDCRFALGIYDRITPSPEQPDAAREDIDAPTPDLAPKTVQADPETQPATNREAVGARADD